MKLPMIEYDRALLARVVTFRKVLYFMNPKSGG